jgi:hypothetical protein
MRRQLKQKKLKLAYSVVTEVVEAAVTAAVLAVMEMAMETAGIMDTTVVFGAFSSGGNLNKIPLHGKGAGFSNSLFH